MSVSLIHMVEIEVSIVGATPELRQEGGDRPPVGWIEGCHNRTVFAGLETSFCSYLHVHVQ